MGNNPVNFVDPWGLAHFGKRPLSGFPGMINNPTLDYLNKEVSHEHIWFDDNIVPSNVGFGPEGLFPEPGIAKKYYEMSPEYFDDALLRKAYKNVSPGNYCLLGNNCQAWAERVREEYRRLEKEQYKNCP